MPNAKTGPVWQVPQKSSNIVVAHQPASVSFSNMSPCPTCTVAINRRVAISSYRIYLDSKYAPNETLHCKNWSTSPFGQQFIYIYHILWWFMAIIPCYSWYWGFHKAPVHKRIRKIDATRTQAHDYCVAVPRNREECDRVHLPWKWGPAWHCGMHVGMGSLRPNSNNNGFNPLVEATNSAH